MLKEMMWHSKTHIRVPVHGGPHDGAEAMLRNLEPGKVMYLAGERYEVLWKNGQPRLIPSPN